MNMYLKDRYAPTHAEPTIDSLDWNLLDATEQNGYTRIKVSRAITAGEPNVDIDFYVSFLFLLCYNNHSILRCYHGKVNL